MTTEDEIGARRVTVYLDTTEDREALRMAAFTESCSVSAMAKKLLMRGLKAHQKDQERAGIKVAG